MTIDERLESAGEAIRTELVLDPPKTAETVRRGATRRRGLIAATAVGMAAVAIAGAGLLRPALLSDEPEVSAVPGATVVVESAVTPPGSSVPLAFDADRIVVIQEALAGGTIDTLSLDPPPTPAEITEAARRNQLREEATPTVIRKLIGDDHYAGQWSDPETGEFFVAVTEQLDPDTAATLLAGLPATPTIVTFKYSFDELSALYDELIRRMPQESSVGLYVDQNKIGIAINDQSQIDLTDIPDDATFFEAYDGPFQLDLGD